MFTVGGTYVYHVYRNKHNIVVQSYTKYKLLSIFIELLTCAIAGKHKYISFNIELILLWIKYKLLTDFQKA